MLMIGAGLSIFSVIGNAISAFPLQPSVKWIALFLICVLGCLFSDNKKYGIHIMFGVLAFVVCLFLPFAFMDSGGSDNNAIGYYFLLLITIAYLFAGWRRVTLVGLLIASFIVMHALEYYRPDLIAVYSERSQFVDRMIQIPVLLLLAFIILLRFAKEYERVNEKLRISANIDELTGCITAGCSTRPCRKASITATADQPGSARPGQLKKVNDKYGHSVGDEALKKLSELLQKSFQLDKHIVCRWGGDEFAIIYYGEKDELVGKLENLEKAFKAYISAYEETTGISMSIITFSDHNQGSRILVEADHLLYKEKLKKDARAYLDGDAPEKDTVITEI
jgi:diguanylate cyclase (GGDEF)-like protein